MLRPLAAGIVALACVLLTPTVSAQPADPLDAAQEALRNEQYSQAERELRAFIGRTPAEPGSPEASRVAEAYYLLSRLYREQTEPDDKQAEKALEEALELDPGNPTYLTAELVVLRAGTWNFSVEKARERRRRELATQLLAIDSTNAFAHEELGTQAIRDFWFYRDAVALPNFALARPLRGVQPDPATMPAWFDSPMPREMRLAPIRTDSRRPMSCTCRTRGRCVDVDDPFSVERITSQGAAVIAFSNRADRAYDQAIGHLEAALRYDRWRRPVYERMMELYALSGRYADALPTLQQMFVHFPEDEEMWRFLGLANLRLGNHAGAAKSFDEALERMTPERRAAFDDLALILPDDEMSAYRFADPDGYRARYWTSRNPRFLTPYNERKLGRCARLTYADLLYESDDLGLPGWAVERGQILVGSGAPLKDVTIVGDFEQALHAFGFATMQQENERGFGRDIDMQSSLNVFNVWDYGAFKFVFEDPFRNGEFQLYSPPCRPLRRRVRPLHRQRRLRDQGARRSASSPRRTATRRPAGRCSSRSSPPPSAGDDGHADLYISTAASPSPRARTRTRRPCKASRCARARFSSARTASCWWSGGARCTG